MEDTKAQINQQALQLMQLQKANDRMVQDLAQVEGNVQRLQKHNQELLNREAGLKAEIERHQKMYAEVYLWFMYRSFWWERAFRRWRMYIPAVSARGGE